MSDIDMSVFAEKMGVSKKYKQGDIIFNRGDEGDCMFIVQSGSVELRVDDKLVDCCKQNDAIGYMSLIDGSVRSSTATASSDTEVSILNERHFRYMVDEVPNFAMYLMETMAQRIRGMARALD